MASCMECIHFNPCNMHGKIIVEKPTEGNDWALHDNVESECKDFLSKADVEEVKHGYWKDRYGNKYDNHLYECSVCGKKALYEVYSNELQQTRIRQVLSNACPHCLAKMDGKDETEDA